MLKDTLVLEYHVYLLGKVVLVLSTLILLVYSHGNLNIHHLYCIKLFKYLSTKMPYIQNHNAYNLPLLNNTI